MNKLTVLPGCRFSCPP